MNAGMGTASPFSLRIGDFGPHTPFFLNTFCRGIAALSAEKIGCKKASEYEAGQP
jgi:hypothetical protein